MGYARILASQQDTPHSRTEHIAIAASRTNGQDFSLGLCLLLEKRDSSRESSLDLPIPAGSQNGH